MSSVPTTTPHPLGEPPDHGGSTAVPPCPPPVSFRDKVMGNTPAPPVREKSDLIEKNLVSIVHEHGNRLLPKVYLNQEVFNDLCAPWRDSLVVKLLGKTVGYNMMKEKLKRVWKPAGCFDILDVDNGFFMVKFDMEADREKALSDGPWMLYDHYLAVTRWTPEFVSPNAKIDRTTVWIRFPGLNLVYYDESFLLALASAVGKPIKVDRNTLKVERGRFARICVEIDLNQPVVGKVWLNGYWYKVAYEGLHIICSNCGCYGHLGRNCKTPPPVVIPPSPEPPKAAETSTDETGPETEGKNQEVAEEALIATPMEQGIGAVHGDWLVVSRRKRTNFTPKEPLKNNIVVQLSNNFDKLSTTPKVVGHVAHKGKGQVFNIPDYNANFVSPFDGKILKGGWKVKKRRHDEGTSHQATTVVADKPKPTEKKQIPQKKEIPKSQKVQTSSPQTVLVTRKPLQDSTKQNVMASPAVATNQLKDFRTAMNIEHIEKNHFRFAEENKPPDTKVDSMELIEETKEGDTVISEVSMQEDSEMGMEYATSNVPQS